MGFISYTRCARDRGTAQSLVTMTFDYMLEIVKKIIQKVKKGTLNVPRHTVGRILLKFNVRGTLGTLLRDRERKLSMASTRFLIRQVVKNPRETL